MEDRKSLFPYIALGAVLGGIVGVVLLVFVLAPASAMGVPALLSFPQGIWSATLLALSAALGSVIAYSFLLRSVTRQYQDRLKGVLAVNQSKDSFISMVLHHLRTPLAGMRWIVKDLLDHSSDKFPRQALEQLYAANVRSLDAVTHLITASQASMERITYQFEAVPLDQLQDVIAKGVQLLEASALAKDLQVKTSFSPATASVNVDKEKVATIVQTLLENSIHYTPSGGTITIATEQQEHDFVITVSDTGIGIPAEEKDRIFTQFYRAKNAVREHPEGFGVGMFLVKTFVDRHQGTVTLAPNAPKGTTVTVRIPLYISRAAE